MTATPRVRRWQFSLWRFLIIVSVAGPIVGALAMTIPAPLGDWKPPPAPPATRPHRLPMSVPVEPETYYESGETPLY